MQNNNPAPTFFSQTYFHGTKADLKMGDLIETGLNSNYGKNNQAKYIYLTASLDAAIWGAEIRRGCEKESFLLFLQNQWWHIMISSPSALAVLKRNKNELNQ